MKSLPPTKRDFGLDTLRAAAILSVLALHLRDCVPGIPAALDAVFARGWLGVDLFFVLSGFLISRQLVSLPNARPGPFWVRRWTRTLPLYFVVLFVYAVIKPRVFGFPFTGDWRFIFFLQNFGNIPDFVQSWSLCIEEQFYVFFPLFFLAAGRFARRPVFWLWPLLFSVVARTLIWRDLGGMPESAGELTASAYDFRIRFATLCHLDGLSVGIFLGVSREFWPERSFSARILGLFVGAGVLILAGSALPYAPRGPSLIYALSLYAMAGGALLWALEGWTVTESRMQAVVERIAVWSYGAYLWNNLVLRTLAHVWAPREVAHGSAAWVVGAILFFGLTLGLAAVTFRFVEEPGLRLRRRL